MTSQKAAPADHIISVGALQERVRRALYEYVVAQGGGVSREAAASAVGIKRGLAAFHLDKLVESHLLEATFRRPAGRTGPGAGRPTKYYSRAADDVAVTLPPRRYELVGQMLIEALDHLPRGQAGKATRQAAMKRGHDLVGRLAAPRGTRRGRELALLILGRMGFEPVTTGDGEVMLRNCPFGALAADHPEWICEMNACLVRGIIEGSGAQLAASLAPDAGRCCVVLRRPQRQ
ncbi:MAG: helix-turn-helix transcriptional regulator [Candidatus Dormibacteria bacterium]